ALRYHGHLLVGVFFSGTLAGPAPWHVDGKATIKLLFFSVSVHFDHQFGGAEAPPLPGAGGVGGEGGGGLGGVGGGGGGGGRGGRGGVRGGEPPVVTLRENGATGESLVVHPLAELTVRERVVPLNRPITRVGSAPVRGGTTTVTVAAAGIGTTPVPLAAT